MIEGSAAQSVAQNNDRDVMIEVADENASIALPPAIVIYDFIFSRFNSPSVSVLIAVPAGQMSAVCKLLHFG